MHHTAVVAVTYLQESQKVREEVSYSHAKPDLKPKYQNCADDPIEWMHADAFLFLSRILSDKLRKYLKTEWIVYHCAHL